MRESVSGKTAVSATARPPASTLVLWIALATLVALHAVAALVPGRWLWGVDALRDLPSWGWLVWAACAFTLVPAVGAALAGRLRALGRALERPLPLLLLSLAAAALVLLLPDRVQFVGDFLLRQGASEEQLPTASLFPQALPLDLFLHVQVPVWMVTNLHWSANFTSRLTDATEAAVLSLLAMLFARRVAPRGPGLLATAAIVWWGGWLALLTGYSKAFSEMVVLTLAAGVCGLDALRGRRAGFWWLCVVVTAALALHRSALGYLPALAYVSWLRMHGGAAEVAKKPKKAAVPSGAPAWLPLLLPLVALVIALPKIWMSVSTLDTGHFSGQGGIGGIASRFFDPVHLLDLPNAVLLLVPLAPLALLPAPRSGDSARGGREWVFLVLLGLPFWVMSLVMRPSQGLARDYDVFTFAAMALAMVVAVRWARGWAALPEAARWSAAVIAGSAVPVFCLMLVQADLDHGLARVRSLADGPPERSYIERAKMREFLGGRLYRLGRFAESMEQYGKAVELAPSPNTLAAWGMAAQRTGDIATEERAFVTILQRAPEDRAAIRAAALTGLARIQYERGDKEKARELLDAAFSYNPVYPPARQLARRMAAGKP